MNYFSYFTEIEETFVRRRGRNLLLSPLDWALIEAWKEREIPLPVVIRAIESVFDAADSSGAQRKRQIKSLMYCREEVEAQYNEWLSRQVGEEAGNGKRKTENGAAPVSDFGSQFSTETVLSHLRRAEEILRTQNADLNHNWNQISAQIAGKLKKAGDEFGETADFDRLENLLEELDRLLDRSLLESYQPAKLAALKNETAAQLRAYKSRMTTETYAETFKTLLLKSVREEAGLPRLSLFYL